MILTKNEYPMCPHSKKKIVYCPLTIFKNKWKPTHVNIPREANS